MKAIYSSGDDELARVFVMETAGGRRVECVDSCQPPIPREEKWVLIVSTLFGCPVNCLICDAGGRYSGRLSAEEIFEQIDFLVRRRSPDGRVPTPKLKVQFARMGDPAFNPAVLEVLRDLPSRFDAPGLMPCISSVAPHGSEPFFESLIGIKRDLYAGGRFQLQLSLHTTDPERRRQLVPARCLPFDRLGELGRSFFTAGDRKIALNFAAAEGAPLEPSQLLRHFPPDVFMVKLTPINPTRAARRSGLRSLIDPADDAATAALVQRFVAAGYDTIASIGEPREDEIGSNCGMYLDQAAALDPATTRVTRSKRPRRPLPGKLS